MLKLILAWLLISALFSVAKATDCETKSLSSSDLKPTLKVEKLVKDVKAAVKLLMQPGEDIQMFKTISYRFQTMKNGGHLYIVKVKYGFLEMYIHLRIEESADGVVLLTGIDKNRTKEDTISCIRAKHGKELTSSPRTFTKIDLVTNPASETTIKMTNAFLSENKLLGKGEDLKNMDEWQCCKAIKDQCHQIPNGDNGYNTEEMVAIKEKIKEMAESAWNRFMKYAGDPGVPQLKTIFDGHNSIWKSWPLEWEVSRLVDPWVGWKWGGWVPTRNEFWCPGATVVTGLDSFIIMNLTKPTETGKTWISTKLSSAIAEGGLMNVKRLIPTYIGSLLSNYFLTNDTVYKNFSIQLGNELLKAYTNKANGLPIIWYRTKSLKTESIPVYDISSPFSALNVEFLYLSSISGNQEFRKNVERLLKTAKMYASDDSLKPKGMFRNTGTVPFWEKTSITWPEITAQSGGNYLDFLFKSWMMGNREDEKLRIELIEVTETFIRDFVKRKGMFTYVSVLSDEATTEKNKHGMALATCYTGGLFALIGAFLGDPYQNKYLTIGESIVKTCRKVHTSRSVGVLSGLPSELFFITDGEDIFAQNIILDGGYRQTGETAESYFILWRLTHNIKYRKWGWELAKSMFKFSTDSTTPLLGIGTNGYANDGYQHQALLSETYKYLYLLFCEDDVFPLDKWIFNANGHPLPIQGTLASF